MDKPIVSVIITTRNSSEYIEACLESVDLQIYKNIEKIVIDNNSNDNTVEIARKYTEKIYNTGPERSAQRNLGAKMAKGKYVCFIDSDMELGKKVIAECVEKINEKYLAIVIPEKSFGSGFWAKCKALERSFYEGVGWIESARFFKKDIFQELKGFDEENTGTEDFDLPQRIKDKYGNSSVGRIKSFIRHNESNLSLWSTLKKKFYYAQKLLVYRRKNKKYFRTQANPLRRYILYFSKPEKLFKNPIIAIGMLLMKTLEFAAWSSGYIWGNIKTNKL